MEGRSINVRIWGNRSYNSKNAYAINSVIVGPLYLVRNYAWDFSSTGNNGIKNGKGTGKAYIYHNTFWNMGNAGMNDSDAPPQENMEIINNIILSNGSYTFEIGGVGCVLDYNNHDNTGVVKIKWRNRIAQEIYQNLSEFKNAYPNQEIHGISVNSSFVNPVGGDFSLHWFSPLIDSGMHILGFNDENSPWPFKRSAPDIGAAEYQKPFPPQNFNEQK